jgi:mannose-6-phosphate isomerase-like protein (cupin superfamily)
VERKTGVERYAYEILRHILMLPESGKHEWMVYVKSGQGKAVINGEERDIVAGDMVDVPAGAEHNFINTGNEDLKLFTVYAPAEHKDGVVHHTKEEAEKDESDHT